MNRYDYFSYTVTLFNKNIKPKLREPIEIMPIVIR